MPLYPILIVVAVALADGGLALRLLPLSPWGALVMALAPMVVVLGTSWLLLRRCHERLPTRGARAVMTAARVTLTARMAIVAVHAAAVLGFGWLDAVRSAAGNLILVDEVLCIAPAIGAWLLVAWQHYPIEKRVREAMLVRQLDLGHPVYPPPSRGGYVLQQARSGLLLLLVPVLLIVGIAEALDRLLDASGAVPEWAATVLKVGSAVLVFTVAPLLARAVLSVRPLASGEVREALLDVCRRHRVRVREILVWHTNGSIINAAVMGLIGPLRYVLLTDALLESMPDPEMRAVMAHEVAHVRRHHMPWLVICLMAAMAVGMIVVNLSLFAAHRAGLLGALGAEAGEAAPPWLMAGLAAAHLGLALLVFGWVSRRFERQADTFAVQHLSGMGMAHEPGASLLVSADAVETMNDALGRIAELNTINPDRHSWRHGSIAWRQAYLSSIVSKPVSRLRIDRVVAWIKLVAGLILIAAIALEFAGQY